MRRSSIVFALLATAVVASSARAADTVAKLPWDGFGEGSWVLQKATSKSVMPGVDMPEQVSESRQTLKKITDKAYTIKTETKVGDAWTPFEYDMPRVADGKPTNVPEAKVEDLGKETVKVEGESIECKKQKSTLAGATTITWTSEKYGLVKAESKDPTGDSTTTSELTKLKASIKVKGNDVECRVLTTTVKSAQMEMTSSTYMSDAIPGGVVRSESSTKMAAMTTTSVVETTDFEKK